MEKIFAFFFQSPPASPFRRSFAGFSFLFLLCLIAFPGFSLRAQNVITVVHNGVTQTFPASQVQTALNAAPNGASVYLPGGVLSNFQVLKTLHIFGAGYFPDSTSATNLTSIQLSNTSAFGESVYVDHTGNGSTLTGLYLQGRLYFNSGTDTVKNISVSRCNIEGWVNFSGTKFKQNSFTEVVFGKFDGPSIIGASAISYYSNCIFKGHLTQPPTNHYDSQFRNCVFFEQAFPTNCVISNCISRPGLGPNSSTNLYYNNLNFGTNGSNGSGNVPNAGAFNVIFEDEANNLYEFEDDLHLVNPAYNTGGTDGTPIGIHGGDWPWKPGGVPSNPHISTKSIGTTTNTSGQLPVNITVRAQGN